MIKIPVFLLNYLQIMVLHLFCYDIITLTYDVQYVKDQGINYRYQIHGLVHDTAISI